jgi:hypothetical protein
MANAIAKQLVLNGTRNYIVRVTITGDGSGEETATRLNVTSGDLGTACKLMAVQASFTGFSGTLLWDASTDVKATQIVAEKDVHLKWWKSGGLVNNAGTGVTGDILITTVGLGTGDIGEITLFLKKK